MLEAKSFTMGSGQISLFQVLLYEKNPSSSYKTRVICARNMLETMRLALSMFLTLYFSIHNFQTAYFKLKDKY